MHRVCLYRFLRLIRMTHHKTDLPRAVGLFFFWIRGCSTYPSAFKGRGISVLFQSVFYVRFRLER